MKIVNKDGTRVQHVAGAVCGIRAKEVILDGRDFHYLANRSTPEELKHWAIQLSHRFPPPGFYDEEEAPQSLIGRK